MPDPYSIPTYRENYLTWRHVTELVRVTVRICKSGDNVNSAGLLQLYVACN